MEELLKVHHGKYCVGDNLTIADLFLISLNGIFERLSIKFEDYPTLAKIKDNIEELTVFKQTLPSNLPDFEPLP